MSEIIDDLPLWSAPFGLTLLDTVKIRKGIEILDIGSGSGFPMLELAERFGATCQVTGIDPSKEAVTSTNSKIRLKGITNAAIIQGYAEELPFGDGKFGLITSNNGLNNVTDEKKVLAECFRVAASGCQVVFTMNLPHSLIEFYEIYEETLRENKMSEEIQRMKDHINDKRKPVECWRDLINESGFTVSVIDIDGFRIRFTDGTSFLRHQMIRTAFRPPWESLLPPKEISRIFDLLEKKLNSKAAKDGELVMSVPYVCFDCYK
jgi:arsenite methyltransferase